MYHDPTTITTERIRATRRLRAELAKIERSPSPLLEANAALHRLQPWRRWLDWEAVVDQALDAIDKAQAPARWPSDVNGRVYTAAEVAIWVGDVA